MLPIPTLDCGLVRLQFADEELMESLSKTRRTFRTWSAGKMRLLFPLQVDKMLAGKWRTIWTM